jgi:hypothetical protein
MAYNKDGWFSSGLIIVEGNPAAKIDDLRKPKIVIADGTVYDAARLWSLVGFQI